MIKLLIGGSPCTYWSIAQKNNRETEAEGMGWELFKNYLIAKEKFNPDFFLYENNVSAAKPIKEQIKKELHVNNDDNQLSSPKYIEINSALVSAQNRRRFYVHNLGNVKQPEDRGILLRDILETGESEDISDKGIDYMFRTVKGGRNHFDFGYTFDATKSKAPCLTTGASRIPYNVVIEPVKCLTEKEMDYMVRDHQDQRWSFLNKPAEEDKSKCVVANFCKGVPYNVCAEPINITEDGKAIALKAQYYKDNISNFIVHQDAYGYKSTGVAEPINITSDGKSQTIKAQYSKNNINNFCCYESTYGATGVAEPIKVGLLPTSDGQLKDHQHSRIYSVDGKSTTQNAQGGGLGAKTGLYAIPVDASTENIYEVSDGKIRIKDKLYPIKLADGFYRIRKLTVTECCRLQTMPDDYCRAVSNTQAYKGLGNGWTAEVIIHLLDNALHDIPRDEEIVVLSMYDGIGTGRYCLDRMGFTNVKYYAYEIDKYAMQVSMSNYPDIIQCGDAFQVREDGWEYDKVVQ